jgi:uncharacterized phage protein (TIGR02218 family)
MMAGSIGEVKRGETAFTAELRSLAHYLGQQQGRTFQYACDATLGDARCGIDLDSPAHKGVGTVTTASSAYQFAASGLDSFAEGWFTGGLVTWTSGANASRQMEVKRFANSGAVAEIELWRSMVSPIAPGDGLIVTAGCDKTFPTCKAKFANQLNFRGFPHMPGNSYVLAFPVSGDPSNDGSSMNS